MTSLRRGLAPCLVGTAACLLYLATLSNHYTGDSIEYALAIEAADPALLLDPYHPLLHPLGLLFWRLWQLAGWAGRALLPLQVLNALAGGLCAGLLTAIAAALGGSTGLAAAAGLGFAVSGGAWMLSVEAEFVTPALALLLAALWAVLAVSAGAAARRRYPILLGLLTAVAVTGYASSALLVPVVLLGLLADARLDPVLRRRHCLVYLASVALLLAPTYLAFLAAWSGGRWELAQAYFFGRSYGSFTPFDLPHGVYAFLRSLALYPELSLGGATRDFLQRAPATGRLLFAGYYGLVLLAVLAPAWLAWRHRRALWPAARRPLLVLAAWTVLFAAFAFYWVPGDQSFWLPVLAAWWLLVSLVLAAGRVRGLRLAAVLVAVAVLALGNALFEIVPRHDLRRNAAYHLAQEVAANTTAEDALLVRTDDLTGLYLAYWGDRQVSYVHGDQEGAAELLARVVAARAASGAATRRLIAVDSDGRRAGWWQGFLETAGPATAAGGMPRTPTWHAGAGMVVVLDTASQAQ